MTRPPGIDPAAIELHLLDPRYVPGDEPLSASGQILWTAGARYQSELWRFVPGAAEPERLFVSAHADGGIVAIAASSAGYAFVEESERAYGKGGWRLFFLAGPGLEPVEVDRGSAPGAGVPPTITMAATRLAWAAFDEPTGGPVSRLRFAPIDDLGAVTTLIDAPIADRLLWDPAFSGDELWYATIKADADATGVGDELHIESIDLTQPASAPVRFAGRANDFSPALNDAYVVWKVVEPGDSALNWGTLKVLDRQSGDVRTIPVDHANRPSIGDRFATFEEIFHRRLAVYDPVTNRVLDLADSLAGATDGRAMFFGQSVSGRLLAFGVGSPDNPTQGRIGWAMLPE